MKKIFSAALLCLATTLPALAQKAVTIEPEIQAGGYNNLNTALKAVNKGTENTYVITINKSIDGLNETIIAGSNGDKDITIQGATNDIVVKLAYPTDATSFKMLLNMNANATGSLTVKNITFDCDNKVTTNDFMAQGAASLNLENVTIKNLIYNGTNANGFRPGMLRLTGNPQSTTLNNLRFENCTVEGDNAPYNVMNGMSETSPVIIGNFDYILALNNQTSSITDGGITTENPTLYVTSNRTLNQPIVYGSTAFSKFTVNNTGKTQFMLAPADGNLNAIAKNKVLIVNTVDGVETGTGYPGLVGSSSGVDETSILDGALIVVNEDINFGSGWSLLAGKTVEIRGANQDVTITRTSDKFFVNAKAAGTNVTVSNICLNNNLAAGFLNALISVTSKESSVTLNDVVVKNCNNVGSTASRSDEINQIITCSGTGTWHLNNVDFENCTVGDDEPLVATDNIGCSVSGINNGLSILVNNAGTNSIDAKGLEAGSEPIKLTLDIENAIHDHTLITNCEYPSLFEITNPGWTFQEDENGGLKILDHQIVTGVEEVAAEADGVAEYFDLSGQRVSANALSAGIYVCRKGGKTTKIAIR